MIDSRSKSIYVRDSIFRDEYRMQLCKNSI